MNRFSSTPAIRCAFVFVVELFCLVELSVPVLVQAPRLRNGEVEEGGTLSAPIAAILVGLGVHNCVAP